MYSRILILLLLHSVNSLSTTETITRSCKNGNNPKNVIFWFRDHALRVQDNAAFTSAVQSCSNNNYNNDENSRSYVMPIYLLNKDCSSIRSNNGGSASDVFTIQTLQALNNTSLHGTLTIFPISNHSDKTYQSNLDGLCKTLISICQQCNVFDIYYSELSYMQHLDDSLKSKLIESGITPHCSFPSSSHSLLDYSYSCNADTSSDDNGKTQLSSSSSYCVPWKAIVLEHPWRSPLIPFVDFVKRKIENQLAITPLELLPIPKELLKENYDDCAILKKCTMLDDKITLDDLTQVVGKSKGGTVWGTSIETTWLAGDETASQVLDNFLRSLKAKDGTKRTHLESRLSPYLARGVISPRFVLNEIKRFGSESDTDSFFRRICWRDYTYAVAALFPDIITNKTPIRDGYDPVVENGTCLDKDEYMIRLNAWKRGQTGFPLIDAGQRQLIVEGWMPQKVRLASSTFLVEGLGLSWRDGMEHFADYLVDFDEAINTSMWLNAGCVGLDPYYVGMNYKKRPYWDSDGFYVKKWCEELNKLPDYVEIPADGNITWKKVDALYMPWAAPNHILDEADVKLGTTYPHRICDERLVRSDFFNQIRSLRSEWDTSKVDKQGRDIVSLGRSTDSHRLGMFTPRAFL